MQKSPQPLQSVLCHGSQLWVGRHSCSLFLVVGLMSTSAQLPFLSAVILTYLRMSVLLLHPYLLMHQCDHSYWIISIIATSGTLNLLWLAMPFSCCLHYDIVIEHIGFGIKILTLESCPYLLTLSSYLISRCLNFLIWKIRIMITLTL